MSDLKVARESVAEASPLRWVTTKRGLRPWAVCSALTIPRVRRILHRAKHALLLLGLGILRRRP
jgi:hypothetical protein